MNIIDFNKCPYSDRHGTYGGMAGYKDGVIYNGENWIVKYPKATREVMKGENVISYTTSPLSEYIGSHIFEILGYCVHKTLLVDRNDKIAVACKDFCKNRGDLVEMRTIKNSGNELLSAELQVEFHDSKTGEAVNLKELLLHFRNNPIFRDIPSVIPNFWETAIIDILIDNNDRNNGNRGLLYDDSQKKYSLAPVYDNGNCFNNKMTEDKVEKHLAEDKKAFSDYACGSRTAYMSGGHTISAKKFISMEDPDLNVALIKVVPNIHSHLDEIKRMIEDIPEEYNGKQVCTQSRKELYCRFIDERYENLLYPAFDRALTAEKYSELPVTERLKRAKELSLIREKIRPKKNIGDAIRDKNQSI